MSLCNEEDENAPSAADVAGAFGKLEKFLVRDHILSGNPRIDGRDVTTVRPITVKTWHFATHTRLSPVHTW